MHAHKPKYGFFFAITLSKFFLSHLLSFFPAFLLPLPFSMHILSCCRIKKFRISFGQSLEMESWYRYGGPFYHHLCSKTDNVRCFLICYVRMPSISKPDHCSDRSLPALLNAYQDYLLIGKLMTSQVLQKARPLWAWASINILDTDEVFLFCGSLFALRCCLGPFVSFILRHS